MLLPFYDKFLKGKETDWDRRPPVEYFVRGANVFKSADTWPPPGVKYKSWFLAADKSGSVTSLNDGTLSTTAPDSGDSTSYNYPNPGWVSGVVGFGASGPPNWDPVRRVLTFTTPPLEKDLEIAGPIKLVLYASSTAKDTDFVKHAALDH